MESNDNVDIREALTNGSSENQPKYEEEGLSPTTKVEEENRVLRLHLQRVRERRRRVLELAQKSSNMLCLCRNLENQSVVDRQQAFHEYRSAYSRKRQVEQWLEVAQRWNVTDDCFHIWYDGNFGTINSLRLGNESHVSTAVAISQEVNTNGLKNPYVNGAHPISPTDVPPNQQQQLPLSSPPPSLTATIKVPWNEINAALGLVALLLSSMENRPQSNITFQHEILPMGNTSKVGIRRSRRDDATSPTTSTVTSASNIYPLHSDDRFQFFGKRNFNVALNALVQCLYEAAEEIRKRDRTMCLPHEVAMSTKLGSGGGGEWTIGGLPISYGVDGEQWTRAMKYFLTDVKWCVAYLARHVDR